MYFEDFVVGAQYDIAGVTIKKDRIISFANEYDPLNFHMDEDYANETHFKGLIAPGVMSFMSVWANFVRMNIWGDNLIAGKSTKIQWFAPVYAEDVLSGRARITAVSRRNESNGIVEITIDIYNQNGVRVITDVTETIIRSKPADNKR